MPQAKAKIPTAPIQPGRSDLCGRYRELAIPAVVAACMANKAKRGEPAATRRESASPSADRD